MNELSLDREGFTLVQHTTSCADERDPEILRNSYLNEMVAFIKDYFNASWVVPKGDAIFVRRAGLPVIPGTDVTAVPGVRAATVGGAHIDYTAIAGPMLAARENQLRGIPIRSYSRLMIINTWRAVSQPPQDNSLALCDSSSVLDTDILVDDYTDKESGFTWKAGLPRYSALHRWYYFADMTPDELIMFKGYDTAQNYNVVHAGFDNRRAYPNASIRESIEARFYVYYD
ncbi:CmcJ/NvfI family oxidoreductase [Bradyrhizobium lupini]|uniref:CmcJ/NvfI family oxidoreductase n=1 Tax=Rhizobium lupini TaxID=136996 RepID=UPI0036725465